MNAYDKPAAHRRPMALPARPQALPLGEELVQAVSRGAGIVALVGTLALLGWLVA